MVTAQEAVKPDLTRYGEAVVVRGNALALDFIPDSSVDLICTSPPYFGLRSYQDGGEHYAGQIGAEATPAEFVDALIAATREMVRVLKPSGSIWVNLGDKYAGSNGGGAPSSSSTLAGNGHIGGGPKQKAGAGRASGPRITGAPNKSLIMIPARYAIRCIDELGLILRAEVIWSKPNGLPESVTDRVRRSHEVWFHFTKSPRYFSAVDEIREANAPQWAQRRLTPSPLKANGNRDRNDGWSGVMRTEKEITGNPLGKLPGSVWAIPTQPLKVPAELGVDHFAAFPMEWPRRIISGWSPSGICTACGEGRRPVTRVTPVASKPFAVQQHERSPLSGGVRNQGLGYSASDRDRTITGYACACVAPTTVPVTWTEWDAGTESMVTRTEDRPDPAWINPAPTTPSVVLDPFGGTGTTALMAKALGRLGISVDLSADYCRLAEWRTTDPKQWERALRCVEERGIPKGKRKAQDTEQTAETPEELSA